MFAPASPARPCCMPAPRHPILLPPCNYLLLLCSNSGVESSGVPHQPCSARQKEQLPLWPSCVGAGGVRTRVKGKQGAWRQVGGGREDTEQEAGYTVFPLSLTDRSFLHSLPLPITWSPVCSPRRKPSPLPHKPPWPKVGSGSSFGFKPRAKLKLPTACLDRYSNLRQGSSPSTPPRLLLGSSKCGIL